MTGHVMWLMAIGLLLGAVVPRAGAAEPSGSERVRADLLADTKAVEPGKPFRVAVRFRIDPGWHIYWLNPGDSGQPTEVKWSLPPGFRADALQWPAPHRFALPGDLVNFGYEGEAVLIATITPPTELQSSTVSISADLNWLVCTADICLPGEGSAALSLPVGRAVPDHGEQFAGYSAALLRPLADAPARVEHGASADTLHWNIDPGQVELIDGSAGVKAPAVTLSHNGRVTRLDRPAAPPDTGADAASVNPILIYHDPADGRRVGIELPYYAPVSARPR